MGIGVGARRGLLRVSAAVPAGGQQMGFNPATQLWEPQTPASSSSELAYQANTTGVVTTSTNGQVVDIPGVTLVVPPSTRPVWLRARATCQQTVVGVGDVSLYVQEITGATTLVTNFLRPLPNVITGGCFVDVDGEFRLGPVAAQRTFKLQLVTIVSSGAPAVKSVNTVANPSYLRAEAH